MFDATCARIRQVAQANDLALPDALRPDAVPHSKMYHVNMSGTLRHGVADTCCVLLAALRAVDASLSLRVVGKGLRFAFGVKCALPATQPRNLPSVARSTALLLSCYPAATQQQPQKLCLFQVCPPHPAPRLSPALPTPAAVFRSAVDSWAIQQLFPIMPIHRLGEEPCVPATLADLTCDSDGKVDRFINPKVSCLVVWRRWWR
jgi:hypothetical protein